MVEVEDGVIWKRYADQLLQADTRQNERENSDFDSLSATSTAEYTQASTDTNDLDLTPDDTNSGGSQRVLNLNKFIIPQSSITNLKNSLLCLHIL